MSDQVAFVRADHYFNFYNQAHDLPFNLSLTTNVAVRDGTGSPDAERVLDGTPNTVWSSPARSSWFEFDLRELYQISRYVLRHAGASGMDRRLNTRNFSLAASTDGQSWTIIDQQGDNSADVTDVDLNPVKARYLRLAIDNPGADSITRIGEMEIYGY